MPHPMSEPWLEWRPIETAPKDGTRVLVYVPGDLTFVDNEGETNAIHDRGVLSARWEPEVNGWVVGGQLWNDESLLLDVATPTLWTPLPTPTLPTS